jgi:hypothetical protein
MNIQSKTLIIFRKFVDDIVLVFPEWNENIQKNYSETLKLDTWDDNSCTLLQTFLDNVNTHSEYISNKDDELFTNDYELLPHISFKDIWNSNISDNTRNIIWKYLQTFSVININMKSNDQLQSFLVGDKQELSKDDKKDLKAIKKLHTSKKAKKKQKQKPNPKNPEIPKELDGLMNTSIGKMAKEIMDEIDMDSFANDMKDTTNPMDILQNGKLFEIFGKINGKVSEKLKNNPMNEDTLKKDAEKMQQMMGSNPLFNSMINNPEMKKMAEEFSQQNFAPQETQSVNQEGDNSTPINTKNIQIKKKEKKKGKKKTTDTEN